MNDDAELLRRYVEDCSEEAFAELVRRHLKLVYFAALRQVGGDTHRAEDVTQSVFTDLARKASSLTRHSVLTGWLYTSTHYAAAKAVRAERRRQAHEQEAQTMHELLHDTAPEADWERLRPVIDDALLELNEPDRQAVLLRFFDGRPFADIGKVLRLTDDAARMRVERALEKLRTLLAKRGMTSTSTALAVALTNQAAVAAPVGLVAKVTGSVFASVGQAAAPAVSLLQFMTTTKFTASIAAAVAILAIGTATHEVFASREAETSLAAAQQDYNGLSMRLHGLRQRTQTVEQDRARLQKALDEAHAAQAAEQAQAAAAAQAARATTPTRDEMAEGQAFLARHPEFKQALVNRSRARVNSRYRPLYRSLNLTPTQIEQFENLLIEGEGVHMGTPETNGQLILRPGTGLTRAEVESRVHDLLGDAGYQQYQETTRLIPARQFTLQVAGALYFTDTPLTPPQADQLARIIDTSGTEARRTQASRNDYWNAVLAKAQGVLSAPQLAVLASFQQQEQPQQELARVMKGSMLPVPGWGPEGKNPPNKP